jgi:membrane-bound lytic murein transglycosylase D
MPTMKNLILIFAAILILPAMGFTDFEQKKPASTNGNHQGNQNLLQIDYQGNRSLAVEAAVFKRLKENNRYQHFYNPETTADESNITSDKFTQQLMEQSLSLCQLSQEYWRDGELGKAIELLDQAYLLVLGINTYEDDYLIRQKDELRFMISRRIIEIYTSRKNVISGSQNEIPLTINKQVQYEIDLYTKGELRNHFIASYRRSGKYRPMILNLLRKEDLPQELSWLPLIESGFRVKALSKARALGLWQFIPSTGHKFGLSRNRYIDERLDPEKSTQAAIDYLKELHSHFGDWTTVLAAYNCGEKRVFRVIRKQKINYLDNFWDLYTHLPQETARYVPKFLAILHIVKNLAKYGLDKISVDSPIRFDSLTVTKGNHLNNIAQITGINRKVLEELNPELRQNIIPGGKYRLKIPGGNMQNLLANIDQILHLNPALVDFYKHRVQSGETLSLIARRYRTSVSNIMLANDLHRANYIVSGKTLKIPRKLKPSANGF